MSLHIVNARREQLEKLIARQRYLPLQEVCKRLGISEATARRDLVALEEAGRITRTHGGALGEFNERFPSYSERQKRASKSKSLLARTALQAIHAGGTYFFDSGTTIAYLATALAEKPPGPMKILTVNLPAAEVLSHRKEIEVSLTGGQLLPRQSVLLGSGAVRTIEAWSFDAAFLSVEGMDSEGLWNSQLAVIAHQHAAIRRARRHVFLVDHLKLGHRAPHFLLPWDAVDCLATDAPAKAVQEQAPEASRRLWLPGVAMPSFAPDVESGAPQNLPVHYL